MAKRKAAKRKVARRKAVTMRRKAGRRPSARKKAAAAGRKTASAAKRTAKKSARTRTASARKATKRVAKARKAARSTKSVVKRAAPVTGKVARRAAPVAKKKSAAPASKKVTAPVRTAPGLNRERRTIRDDDIVQTPPSSLDFDRSASAARSGRRELREKYDEHTETSPALTGGDVDADWESAYSVGDEAPGGDNPTPDQDLVDDIGRAIGIEYQDNEELKGDAKVSKRDRNRWELDPASSDDWDER
jgi:hypothetical protein